LFSAGWIWHPWDAVVYFDVAAALSDPTHLDSLASHARTAFDVDLAEESSACWLSDDQVAVGSSASEEVAAVAAEQKEAVRPVPSGIALFDVPSNRYIRSHKLPEPPGTMMRVDESHVVAFYQHPKVISLATGEVLQEWRDLRTGTQTSSICDHRRGDVPPMACDPARCRFAVADGEAIHVVTVAKPS